MIVQLFPSILVFILTIVLYFEFKRLKLSRKFKHIPSIKECPIIGTKYVYQAKYDDLKDVGKVLRNWIVNSVCKFFIGPKMFLVASDPELLQRVFRSPKMSYRSSATKLMPFPKGIVFSDCKRSVVCFIRSSNLIFVL